MHLLLFVIYKINFKHFFKVHAANSKKIIITIKLKKLIKIIVLRLQLYIVITKNKKHIIK